MTPSHRKYVVLIAATLMAAMVVASSASAGAQTNKEGPIKTVSQAAEKGKPQEGESFSKREHLRKKAHRRPVISSWGWE